jgi:hypothetical protein
LDPTPALLATGDPVESRVVLVSATIGATIPTSPAMNEKADTVQNQLVCVVTLTYPERVYPSTGSPSIGTPEPTPSSALRSHFSALIDAQSGQLIWGFFTK